MDTGLAVNHSVQIAACALRQKAYSLSNDVNNDLGSSVCGDCKFLLLEDLGTPGRDSYRRLRGRFRNSSSESIENILSDQFPHMTVTARQNQSTTSGLDDQPVDGDTAAWLLQCTSSHTTPSGSRRWRRVMYDTESDGFDNVNSLYGDSESNVSFGPCRFYHGESDSFSFSAHGGDSDAFADGHSFMDTETFILPDMGSDVDSDSDIDPMHAGVSQWDSDDLEEEDEEEDEEDEVDGKWLRLRKIMPQLSLPISSCQFQLPFYHGGAYGDYLDARSLEILLEHLAQNDSSRQGSPPAAASFVIGLPRIIISEEHEKHDGLACAICKDVIACGTEVNQLPCLHLYHPSCILPWLSNRNSCPLFRYELPTDDNKYEECKWNTDGRMEIHEIQQQNVTNDSSDANEEHEFSQNRSEQRKMQDVDTVISSSDVRGGRGRWAFLAAAPIVSLVGFVIVLWVGNPLSEGRGPAGHCNLTVQNLLQIHVSVSPQRENRRRWWSLF
ncbi:E3 ubiquitin-protein ligase RING1-like protein [Quillaja saponaria]|uniref:RING-type E3 ubiquitin transferase n=1 Tax=Quillaja saponaria TaxID=32244 RepID=A0AAD7L3V2_QUISA|nr:E3 ubiquitin-protein ligase RING1-like protein [Quillaja saponaria]